MGALAAPPQPDAGQVQRDLRSSPVVLPRTISPTIDTKLPVPTVAGGDSEVSVAIAGFRFSGNTSIGDDELKARLPEVKARQFTLAELEAIAADITQYYRDQGYFAAVAQIPQQESADGILEIAISEGKYGNVTVHSEHALNQGFAQSFAEANLCDGKACTGHVMTDSGLQRAMLLLSDIPGVAVRGVLKQGGAPGTADIDININQAKRWAATLGVDSHGSKYTGRTRLSGGIDINNLVGWGDQLSFSALKSGNGARDLWNATLDYSLLTGNSGTRVGARFARLSYQLGGAFAALGASGTSNTSSLYARYPIIRSPNTNLGITGVLEHKNLHDDIDLFTSKTHKSINDVVIALDGDHADHLGGGGATRYNLSVTRGDLDLKDAASIAADATGLQTDGGFTLANFDLSRLQYLPASFNLFGNLRGQVTGDNLTSGVRYSLGGPSGVRAYPIGETGGDEGAIASLELRRSTALSFLPSAELTYGVFYDRGWVTINHNPIPGTTTNSEVLSGAGLSVKLAKANAYSISASWATRMGSKPSAIEPDTKSRLWIQGLIGF